MRKSDARICLSGSFGPSLPVFRKGITRHSQRLLGLFLVSGEISEVRAGQGAFKEVIPKMSVLSSGPGAVELVGRFSDIDLNSGTLGQLVPDGLPAP